VEEKAKIHLEDNVMTRKKCRRHVKDILRTCQEHG